MGRPRGCSGQKPRVKVFHGEIIRVVHVHLDFFEDDLLFVFDVGGIEADVAEIAG